MSSLSEELAGLSLEQRTILETRLRNRRSSRRLAASIPRRTQRERARLSFGQQRLWFLDQLEPGNAPYNIPAAFRLQGLVDTVALQRSLDEVVRRHEVLRTSYDTDDHGQPVQVILPALKLPLPITDLSNLPSAEQEATVRQLAAAEVREPFDLTRAPLLRVHLLRLADDDWVLFYTMHHIVSDAWSLGLLAREVTQLYIAYSTGRQSPLPELPVQYADFAEWQRERWERGQFAAHLSYWKRTLKNVSSELQLPADLPRPSVLSYRGAHHAVSVSAELSGKLEVLSREADVTMFMTLLAVWQLLLHRYTGQDEIVIGSDIACRNRLEIEGLIGFFINTLVLRTDLSGNPTFRELLARVREVCLGAFEHQEVPFDRLVEELQPERSLSRNPLFQVAFTLQSGRPSTAAFPGLGLTPIEVESHRTQFDLCLNLQQEGRSINGYLEYSADLFAPATIEQLAGHFQNLLTAVVARPDNRILSLPLLGENERRRLVHEWSHAEIVECDEAPFHQLFETQVERSPQAPAVVFREEYLSYRELNQRANRIASRLIAEGVRCDEVVALLAERGIHLLTGMLAVFKAGGAYLPLDPRHPAKRNSRLIEQSGVKVLLSTSQFAPALESELKSSGPRILRIDELLRQQLLDSNPPSAGSPNSLAYVIYTSGSTGVPKGAMVEHRGMLNHLCAKITSLSLSENDRVAQTASQCFDISVWQYLAPLLVGGCVEVIEDECAQDPEQLFAKVETQGITILEVVPSLLRVMLDNHRLGSLSSGLALRWLLVTGEALPPDLCRLWLETYPSIPLVNAYGPTECSDDVTQHEVSSPPPENTVNVPIGRPIINARLYILDSQMQPVPRGVAGLLYVGGVCAGRGYLGDPSRTANVFIPDPFGGDPGQRLYQTGDLVRYLDDGLIEFLGRLDHQVKIRGFRIELGEIEAALGLHERVGNCAVVARADKTDAQRLVAYVVPGYVHSKLDQASVDLDQQDVAKWGEVFDEVYDADAYSIQDPSINRRVWVSSYTGESLPEDEIFACLEGTVERLRAWRPRHVLEIGCGTGLILLRISSHCESYCGTDLSPAALRVIERRLKTKSNHHGEVKLLNCAADDLAPVGDQKFDTIIINEVVQYFPSINYLARVLEAAFGVAAPGGRIFIGGVRSFALFETFHTSVQLFQAAPALSLVQLRQRISKHMMLEKELLVDPEFFTAFQELHGRISHVEVQLRPGRRLNELNKFRYDVILHLEDAVKPKAKVEWLKWQGREPTLSSVRRTLTEVRPEMLCVSGLPNGRILNEMLAVELLGNQSELETAGQLREAVEKAAAEFETVDPEDIRKLATELAYGVDLSWSRAGDKGKFDAVFRRAPNDGYVAAGSGLRQTWPRSEWARYGNHPASQSADEQLFRELREHLKEHLPDYMIPSAFVALERLPLTQNGKLDRRQLPEPDTPDGVNQYQGPLTPMERVVAGVWSEVLGLKRVSVRDNFFELGGHSLLATQVMSRLREALGVELALRTLFEASTVTGLALALQESLATGLPAAPAITPANRNSELPLSFAQQRLWFLNQLEPETPVYNLPLAFRLIGRLNTDALERSFGEMVRRHESLRTRFRSDNGRPRQVIGKAEHWQMGSTDLRQLSKAECEAKVKRLIDRNSRRQFDLANEALFRVQLLRLDEEEHVLLLALHHIISDGWSMGVLLKETAALYQSYSQHEQSPLAELPVQYADYAVWQREWFAGEVLDEQLSYWRKQLADAPPALDLPTDKPRPLVPTTNGGRVYLRLSTELTKELRELSRRQNATLFMTMLTAFQALLYRYTAQDDIVVGTPIAGRTRPEIEGIIGFFINTVVLRTDLSGSPSFVELLKRVRRVCLEAYAHQDVPFERLVEELQPARDISHSPLFRVLFAFDAVPAEKYGLEDLRIEEIEVDSGAANFDITLTFEDKGDHLAGVFGFKTDLFEAATIERMARHLETLLQAAIANPAQEISKLKILSEEERAELLALDDTSVSCSPGCIHELFEEQSAKTPDAIALVYLDGQISYGELNRRANQVAGYLQRSGAGAESCVGIMFERSIEMVVTLLGVLKAGAAYVPLDRAAAPERLRFVVDDAGIKIVLTHERLLPRLEHTRAQVVLLDQQTALPARENNSNQSGSSTPSNLAYVIYTSGSTGAPKGVMVQHASAINLLAGLDRSVYSITGIRLTRASLNAPLVFDASVQQLLLLLKGVTLFIVPDEIRTDGQALLSYLARNNVQVFDCTPSQLNVLLDAALLESGAGGPELFLVAGEEMDQRMWEPLSSAQQREFFNIYGPTECTVDVTARRVKGATGVPSIGRPLANTEILLLDNHMQLTPVGVPGEIYVGGANVARGYLNRPDLTAEKFVPHPFTFVGGARLYRTGDRGRYRADREIEFLGRVDQQIKIRGYRIEPGEIETVLRQHGSVQDAIVVARSAGRNDRRLVAYLVPGSQNSISPAALRAYLKERLPEYMIPAAFVPLQSLPLTRSGKIDRRALPEPDRSETTGSQTAPRTPFEQAVTTVWAEVLGVDRVGPHNNFFELGGHSLLATQVVSRVREIFSVELPLRSLFEMPTLSGFAECVENALKDGNGLAESPIERAPRDTPLPLSFAQERLWFIQQFEPESAANNISFGVRLQGRLDVQALKQSLNELVRRHEVLRTRFSVSPDGPVQYIDVPTKVELAVIDLSRETPTAREIEIRRLATVESQGPFNLSNEPPFRLSLLRLDEQDHVLLYTMHHIATDAWSLGVIVREVALLYEAFLDGRTSPLEDLTIHYADYAIWQRKQLQGDVLERHLAYWREQLGGAPQSFDLPTDRPRPPLQTFRGATEPFLLPRDLAEGLKALSRREGVTLFMLLLAAFCALLHNYTEQEDIVIGTGIANRSRPELEPLIGCFFNILALRTRPSAELTFRELLGQVRETTLAAYAHQDIPFEMVLPALQLKRDPARTPLFSVMFAFQNAQKRVIELPGLRTSPVELESTVAKFDLTVFMEEDAGTLGGEWEYNLDLFDHYTMRRMLEHWQCLLHDIAAHPEKSLKDISLASFDQDEVSVGAFNDELDS